MQIPFNKPWLSSGSIENVLEAFDNQIVSGDGPFTARCEQHLEEDLGIKKALLTTSCTHALEICALLLNLQNQDEVIIPSYTFTSTATAFCMHGAKIVFADVRSDTLNIDESQLEKLISSHTKAIVVVHYAGVACEMDTIMAIAEKHDITVIEDNAHGLYGKYRGKYLGTFGAMATQSFHETKNLSCGEGGALLINDEALIERAEIIRQKGTNRNQFLRGEVDKYTWVDIGSSYALSDILAAVLYDQIQNRNFIQQKRQQIWDYYYASLKDWAERHNIAIPFIPHDCEQAYHIFYLVLPSAKLREDFIHYLKEYGISAIFHYQSLHASTMASKIGANHYACPNTELATQQLVRLPLYNSMSLLEAEYIVNAVLKFQSTK